MKDTFLVVGGGGLLGRALCEHGQKRGWRVHATVRNPPPGAPESVHRLDLAQPLGDWRPPEGCRGAVLCASVTSLEACRREPATSRLVNVTQTLRLAERMLGAGLFVIFLSSNLVFDGSQARTLASDPASPRTEYGRQKAEVEAGLRALGTGTAIVRLTKVVHPQWELLGRWIEAWRAGQVVRPFADLPCAPIPIGLTVRGIGRILHAELPGTWQFSPDTDVAYADIARHLAARSGQAAARVEPVSTGVPVPLEHRPQHATLNASRARADLGLAFPGPLDAIDEGFFEGNS